MDVLTVLNVVLASGAVAVAVVAGLSFGSRKALRESNQDLRDRTADLEKKVAQQSAELAKLTADNEVLRGMVTGEVHWKSLTEELDQLIRDAHKHWGTERDVHKTLLETVDKVIKKLEASL